MTSGPRETVQRYLGALHDRAGFGALLSEDVLLEVPGSSSTRGAEAVEAAVRHHYEVEFDARPECVELIADERRVAAELVFAGMHTGVYAGLPPTGIAVRLPLSMVFDVERGVITAIRIYYSPEQLMAQLKAGTGAAT